MKKTCKPRAFSVAPGSALLGTRGRVPGEVVRCPECDRTLEFEIESTAGDGAEEWAETLWLDCGRVQHHRFTFDLWMPTHDLVKQWINSSLPNVQGEPRPYMARSVLLGARFVTCMVVGSTAWLGSFFIFSAGNSKR